VSGNANTAGERSHGTEATICGSGAGRVAKGFNCTVKVIMKNKVKVVLLADDCACPEYKALITGLGRKHRVRMHSIPMMAALRRALALRAGGSACPAKSQRACAILDYGNAQNQSAEVFR
jgi:ribosomal protein L7Ae-like RNA K-turn-binding protein